MDETYRFQADLQQAIANNLKEYTSNYKILLFEGECKPYISLLNYFDNISINTSNNELEFNMKIDENRLKNITKDEKEKIKKISWKNQMRDIMIQKNEYYSQEDKEKVIDQIYEILEAEENRIKKLRKITNKDIGIMKSIQKMLKFNFNYESDIDYSDEVIGIAMDLHKMNLDKIDLQNIIHSALNVDIFTICALYDFENESDEILGIRFCWLIDLEEK